MKCLLKLSAFFILTCSFSIANAQQIKYDTVINQEPGKINPAANTKDYATMINGKMMENRDGKMTGLKSTCKCMNGAKVSTAGLVMMPEGTSRQMKDGDKVYKDG